MENTKRLWMSTDIKKNKAQYLSAYLRIKGIEFESSACDDVVYFEVFVYPDECNDVNDYIDSLFTNESYQEDDSYRLCD